VGETVPVSIIYELQYTMAVPCPVFNGPYTNAALKLSRFSIQHCYVILRLCVSTLISLPFSDHTYLLTPWSRVFLEKLTRSAASQEIPLIFRTWRFITIFTSARHLSLSWVNSI